jgi:hypothetical protein
MFVFLPAKQNMSPKQNEEKILAVTAAWETLKPEKNFGGLSLSEFKDRMKPSFDARTAITTLDNQVIAAQNMRDDADKDSLETILRVVNAVKGDPEEGDDGKLYEAMGYVRKSERSSGLHRNKQAAPAPVGT